jgi:hypothetical protein
MPGQVTQGGHRITGTRQQGSSNLSGYGKVHVAVNETTGLAYEEYLADEKNPTVISFLSRAIGWFNS